jgi:very-short-patch-repair endonuclease
MSAIEEKLLFHIKAAGLPAPEREYRFDVVNQRMWRFDFAYPDLKLAIEVEGVVFQKREQEHVGRHQTALGVEGDCQKYNAAIMQGWRVLRFTQRMVTSGEALRVIEDVLNAI